MSCRLEISTTVPDWLNIVALHFASHALPSPVLERAHHDLTFIKPFPTVSNKARNDDTKEDSEEKEYEEVE